MSSRHFSTSCSVRCVPSLVIYLCIFPAGLSCLFKSSSSWVFFSLSLLVRRRVWVTVVICSLIQVAAGGRGDTQLFRIIADKYHENEAVSLMKYIWLLYRMGRRSLWLDAGHFFWTRPDPTPHNVWPDPPNLPKIRTRPDPTRGSTRPVSIPALVLVWRKSIHFWRRYARKTILYTFSFRVTLTFDF